jgi:cell division protein FtsB
MVTRQEDSIKKLNERKTNEQLSRENAALREQVADLQAQVEEQADALIELAAMVGGEG